MAKRVIHSVAELFELVGKEVGITDWLTVTQAAIDQFADLTGDRQWIHVDAERARRESPYGTTVAHGCFTLALLCQFQRQLLELGGDYSRLINYGLNRVRFPAPVLADARIRARSTLQNIEEIEGGYQLTWA